MKAYYLNNNSQANGDYEVHTTGCAKFPWSNNTALGEFHVCWDAVAEAKRLKPTWKINGCYFCCQPCHTS